MHMKAERKYWVALATLLIIFSGVAAASTYKLILDPAAPVEGSTLYVTLLKDGSPEPGAVVHFVLNGGLPVLNITDAQGKARFKPPVNGTLDIYATTQDGTLLANGQVVVSGTATTPDTIPPVINSVTLNTTTPNIGEFIQVTVDATDNVGVTGVTAEGTALVNVAGSTWIGNITALAGTHTVTVVASDAAGNSATNASQSYITPTPTPTQTTQRISGGGGGGGGNTGGPGVVTSEPSSNVERAETTNGSLQAGNPVKYVFSSPEHWIYEIDITDKVTENNIPIRVEALKGLSKVVPAEPSQESIKKYVNIWSGSKNLQGAIIRFRVQNSLIASEGIADSDVKMLKWDGNTWIKLDTTVIKKDSTYTYYDAQTTTFSHFAISFGTAVPKVTATSGTGAATATSVPTGTTAAATENPPAPSNLYLILFVFLAIVIVSVVYLLTKHGKPK
ncbi:Uncharacterised protein [uncultured archaeon]|nr:Uncharacterised protein [uncultured archaeon]